MEVHNSRQPHESPNPNPSLDPIFIGWRGIMMDYPCAMFAVLCKILFKSILKLKIQDSILKILFEIYIILTIVQVTLRESYDSVLSLLAYAILVLHVCVDSLLLDDLCSSIIVISCNHILYAYPYIVPCRWTNGCDTI